MVNLYLPFCHEASPLEAAYEPSQDLKMLELTSRTHQEK